MLEIVGKTITLTKGDTAYITFIPKLRLNGQTRNLSATDTVLFRLDTRNELVEIECYIDEEENKAVVTIEPEHTINVTPGKYKYEVELITANEEHFTFIADQTFVIGKELEQHGS